MVIGGKDYFVETTVYTPKAGEEFVKKFVVDHWPDAVFEDAGGTKEVEFFIYENEAAKRIWDEDVPAYPSRSNMIYALLHDGEFTFVCDPGCKSEEISKLLCLYFMKVEIMAQNPRGLMVPRPPQEETNGTNTETA